MKKAAFLILFFVISMFPFAVEAEANTNGKELDLTAESAILMEATTGKVIFEKDADTAKPPASVTKIMTLLLIFEDLNSGKLTLEDNVTVSAHAASMGGSQVYLEEGEVQTVDTLIKCIAVSSANDGCVAMAEHISGSETAFVNRMNEKAEELGMTQTNFVNCCGLDVEGHVTSARDIAIMSRELTLKYPDIFNYTTIWMDEFTHKTAKSESTFGLSSTNKMLKSYNGCNGLKTGSTSQAKFCLSATATRNDISLIAVVMACPDSKNRIADVTAMLDYGFANVTVFEDDNPLDDLKMADISGGEKSTVSIQKAESFTYTMLKDESGTEITKNIRILDNLQAPVKENEIIGEVDYQLNGEVIGSVPIRAGEDVKEKTYLFSLKTLWRQLILDTCLSGKVQFSVLKKTQNWLCFA